MTSRKKKKKQFSTAGPGETLNLTEIKTSVYSFAFTFFVSPVQMQCPTLYVNKAFSLVISFDSFFQNTSISLSVLEVKCSWYLFYCTPSQSSLPYFRSRAVGFELPITRTFLYFPRRCELSGVDCRLDYEWNRKWVSTDEFGIEAKCIPGITTLFFCWLALVVVLNSISFCFVVQI